jgi:dihydroorotate dehydrogenase (NAD+) catalytic subunit
VLVAAGGAGYGVELLDDVEGALPAAIVTRGTTLSARPGNPPPRMAPLSDGLLHAIGLPNPGIEAMLRRYGPRWAASDVPIIVNICADTAEGFGDAVRAIDSRPGVAAAELELACPDRTRSGRPFGLGAGPAEEATVAARAATDLPLIVKLTPVAADIREVARAVAAAGADAISATGSLVGLAIDRGTGKATLGTAYGGLSGPALKPVALRIVYEVAQVVRIPIIGVGGVATLDDVLDYLAAGASAVGLATAALADPALPGRLAVELGEWCTGAGVTSLGDVIGTALPQRRDRGSIRGPYRL